MPRTQAAPAADNPPAQAQQQGGIPGWVQSLLRGVVIWYLMSSLSSYMSGKKPEAPVASHSVTQQAHVKPSKTGSYLPMWKYGAHMDLFVYLSEDEYWHSFDERSLIWHEHDVVYGDWEEKRTDIEIEVPETVQNNGSLYAHIYLAEMGHSPNRQDPSFREDSTLYHNKLLTRYLPKRKVAKVKKLIAEATSEPEVEVKKSPIGFPRQVVHSQQQELQEDSNEPTPIVSYWWNNVTIAIVNSDTTIPALLPAPMMKNVRVHEDGMRYFPVFYVNDFWLLSENLHPINSTVKTLQLALSYTPIPWWKYQMYSQFDESFKMQQNVLGAAESDMDDVKRMFLETNPILLGVTMAVSLLHSAFDFLAFKNDIQFWRKRKDMEGLSFRTIILNVFFQTVTLLYLMDNETSWMIIISSGVGLLIEMWKINKTVIVKGQVGEEEEEGENEEEEQEDLSVRERKKGRPPTVVESKKDK
ncbi:hypothetical protein HDU85_005596 [Gaertneriomyces sp. JEL0708]|nr:hypothetical protein HDU85_005596 [Gaertneriomyces sp. JEL0708]